MRIIAGTFRGRRLIGPSDDSTTRPITDRVKQSLFDRLAAEGRLEDAVVADLFCGTGSMGLECMSRGAAHVTFVDRDRDAIRRLKENLATLEVTDRATVLSVDALSAGLVEMLRRRPCGLIFVDPPYAMMYEAAGRSRVYAQVGRLAAACGDNAELVLRAERHIQLESVDGWPEPVMHNYGSMSLHHYLKRARAGEES